MTEFCPLLEGDEIGRQLSATSEALRWLLDEVVDRTNSGMGEGEILADMVYPDRRFDQSWMRPTYGAPDNSSAFPMDGHRHSELMGNAQIRSSMRNGWDPE